MWNFVREHLWRTTEGTIRVQILVNTEASSDLAQDESGHRKSSDEINNTNGCCGWVQTIIKVISDTCAFPAITFETLD